LQAVRNLLHSEGVRHPPPPAFASRIAALPEFAPKTANDNRIGRWLAPGLVGALAASLAMVSFVTPATTAAVDEELVSSHVRSLQPGHLTDVQTTNQHIVKPWFNGRIDFAPPVPELADVGFPLVGGRLDSIDGKTVPAIVYKRRLHTVNLYVWKADASRDRAFVKDGFAVREWSRNGLRFAAISDIPAAELQQFEALFVQRS
jgi:anti-sigma factor RsiW